MTPNHKAFLDMIAYSEIGPALLAISDNGYNVIVGSTPAHPILFHDYSHHPHLLEHLSATLASTAAGRYQVLGRYADAYIKRLALPDFSPASQDAIALQQIRECHALPLIDAGRFADAVDACAHIWASLPGAGYPGQHMNKLADLQAAYAAAGGAFV
ncbi:MAG: glycoside hydrolase [Herbaspirillum sp.]|nr:glycoside hydrolase [Herbaspirillum sp.]